MTSKTIAALLAALALPVAAQTTARPEARPQPASDAKATPHERARSAKAQNRDMKCPAKQKEGRQKKAAAT